MSVVFSTAALAAPGDSTSDYGSFYAHLSHGSGQAIGKTTVTRNDYKAILKSTINVIGSNNTVLRENTAQSKQGATLLMNYCSNANGVKASSINWLLNSTGTNIIGMAAYTDVYE